MVLETFVIFSRKLSQRCSCTLTRFVVIDPLHLYKTPSQANKPPPLLSTYHTFCCIYATKCVDRSTRHDVRFNWKPLSMSNSVGQTFNPNNTTCPGNQFLKAQGIQYVWRQCPRLRKVVWILPSDTLWCSEEFLVFTIIFPNSETAIQSWPCERNI